MKACTSCPPLVISLLVLACWSSLAAAQQDFRAAELLRGLQVLATCRQSTGASEDEIRQVITNRRVPASRSGQCLIACVAQNYGLFRGGQFDPEGAMRLVRTFILRGNSRNSNDPQLIADIQGAISTCSNTVGTTGPDNCELAAKLTQCGLQQADELRARYGRGRPQ